MQMYNPPHPGRIIKDALPAIPMTITQFAAHIGVSRVTLSRVINERAGITPEMSMKVSEAFSLDAPDLLFKLQNKHDFWQAAHAKKRRKVEALRVGIHLAA